MVASSGLGDPVLGDTRLWASRQGAARQRWVGFAPAIA
jgi:hypothetical protein